MADQSLLQQWQNLELGYPPNIGSLQLRQEVSLHYPGTAPDHVLSCVPNEGIFISMAALLAPGDVVVSMYPGEIHLLDAGTLLEKWVYDLGCIQLQVSTFRPAWWNSLVCGNTQDSLQFALAVSCNRMHLAAVHLEQQTT